MGFSCFEVLALVVELHFLTLELLYLMLLLLFFHFLRDLDLATRDLLVRIIQSALPFATLGFIIPEFGGTASAKGFLTENDLEPGTYGLVFKSGFLLTNIGSVVL